MNEREARRFALELMESSDAVYLTTVDRDGFPQTRAMLNLRNRQQYPSLVELFAPHKDDLLVLFTTNTSSGKTQQIRANPAVSAYFCVPAKFHGLMLGGVAEIVNDSHLKAAIWQDGWECYYPKGADDPDNTVLRLMPSVAKGWHGEGPFEFKLNA
jgi:general stress protein 26